jgi:hypothetical protein
MQRFAYGCGIFFSLLSYSSISSAQFVTWNENIPSSLALFQQNPQQLADLAQNNILIYAQPYTKTNVPTQRKTRNRPSSLSVQPLLCLSAHRRLPKY